MVAVCDGGGFAIGDSLDRLMVIGVFARDVWRIDGGCVVGGMEGRQGRKATKATKAKKARKDRKAKKAKKDRKGEKGWL